MASMLFTIIDLMNIVLYIYYHKNCVCVCVCEENEEEHFLCKR